MALALILEVRPGPAGPVLRVDTGTNPLHQWRIGSERREVDGIDELLGVSYESPIQRRIGVGAFQTAFDLPLDARRFDRDHHLVQVVSYKDTDRRAPAWSRIRSLRGYGDGDVWEAARPEGRAMSASWPGGTPPARPALAPARSVAFAATEQPLSAALFWGDLLSLVDDLAPLGQKLLELAADEDVQAGAAELLKLLGPVVKGLLDSAASPTAAPPAATAPVAVPPVAAPVPVVAGAAPGPAVAPPAALPPATAPPATTPPMASPLDFGTISGPALAGLITTLAPTVLKAIGPLLARAPEMFQTYMDHPIKLLTAVADANRQDQVLVNQQVQRMLQSGDQHLLLNLLGQLGRQPQPGIVGAGTSAPLSIRARGRVRARSGDVRRERRADRRIDERVEATVLAPAGLPGQRDARSRYAAGRPITLLLQLGTTGSPPERPIPHVVAQVRVSDAATGSTLLDRRVELTDVWINRPTELTLDAASLAGLPSGADLDVSVDVTWTGRDGAAYTTPSRATQQVTIVGEHLVLGLGGSSGTELRLSDPGRYRSFWHQIWEGGSATHRRWELDATVRYYYRLVGDAPGNGRMDTRFKAVAERSKETERKVVWGGLLKSGMELAVGELNKLLPEAGLEPWSEGELAALASATVTAASSRQATTALQLRGRTGERGSAWVFPVLEPISVDLHRLTSIAPSGAAVASEAAPKPFLFPVAAVFVGMRTEG